VNPAGAAEPAVNEPRGREAGPRPDGDTGNSGASGSRPPAPQGTVRGVAIPLLRPREHRGGRAASCSESSWSVAGERRATAAAQATGDVSPPAAAPGVPVHRPLLSFPLRNSPSRAHQPRQGAPVTPAPIRVLIVDDHAAVRAGLADLMGATGGMVVVGEAVDGYEALALAAELRPDVVLMDVSMPNMSGLEAAHVLTQQQRSVRVLMHSADARGSVVRAAHDAGAVGFLVKGSSTSDIIGAIWAAKAGRPTWPAGA
jgi:CheY-like chemotaxis protein